MDPDKFISKEEFSSIKIYIITKPELHNHTITITSFGKKIVGCPVCIEDHRYSRNEYIFNLCFVFDANTDTDQYEAVVKKLAGYLTILETQSGYLSDEKTKELLKNKLVDIREELNHCRSCIVPINKSTTLYLKVLPRHKEPPSIYGHEVPILKTNSNMRWDLSIQQLLPHMDGCKHITKIANDADVDISIVKSCIQNLLYHDVIKLISIFQYSNVYMVTPLITSLVENKDLQDECLMYVRRQVSKSPSFTDVFRLYCSFTAGTTVRDLCSRYNPYSRGIDERKLVQFGLSHNIIRRLQKYPIKLPNDLEYSCHNDLNKIFDGKHCYDEICLTTGMGYKELDEKVENDPSIVVCWK